VKPDAVFFGEAIPSSALMTSQDEAGSCDLMLVIGTSGEVVPAAQMPSIAKRAGAKIVEINLSRTPLTDRVADYSVYGRAGEILEAMVAKIKTLKGE
jgi:NAD-dependent deacetylase